MMTVLSEITENTWITLGSSVGIFLTLLVNRFFDAKQKREEKEQARLDRESDARIAAARESRILEAGHVRKEEIVSKLEENTLMTKDAKECLTALTAAEQLKSMTTLAKRLGSSDPVWYQVELPPDHYVPFELAEGGNAYWKSEPCDTGRQVRYMVEGPCVMGFHFHRTAEIVSGVRGTLFYETAVESVQITPGVIYTTPADTVHSARFEAPGEVVVHWPEQTTNILDIGIFP